MANMILADAADTKIYPGGVDLGRRVCGGMGCDVTVAVVYTMYAAETTPRSLR